MNCLELETVNCPVCNSRDWVEVYFSKDYLFTQDQFTVVCCTSCALLYTNPRVPEDKIENYYFNNYFSYQKKDSGGILKKIKQKINNNSRDFRQSLLKSLKSTSARNILEIGPGNGELLFFLKEQGFCVTGIELYKECVDKIKENNISCYLGDLDDAYDKISAKKYDAIIYHHVFEHLYNPISSLEKVYNLLRENGRLYIALPNNRSLEAKIFGKYWKGLDLPRHIVHYDSKSIVKILDSMGFRVEKINAGIFPSSFIESIGFMFLKQNKLPKFLYLLLYYPYKLFQCCFIGLTGSGIMEITAKKKDRD